MHAPASIVFDHAGTIHLANSSFAIIAVASDVFSFHFEENEANTGIEEEQQVLV